MFNLLFSFIIVFCFSIFIITETKAQSFLGNGQIPKNLEITLQCLGCSGSCPNYKMTIKSDVNIFFYGKNTKVKGEAKGKIDQEKLREIVTEFEKVDFFKLNDSYASENDGCEIFHDDYSTEIISIKINDLNKQIKHDFGCLQVTGNALERISNLGRRIDEITNSKIWIEPVTPLFSPKKKSQKKIP